MRNQGFVKVDRYLSTAYFNEVMLLLKDEFYV